MGSLTLDIRGQLNSMNLSDSKSLWPLFEAVVNAIQSVEDSDNRHQGRIQILAKREETPITMDGAQQLGRFESFTVIDNGSGFNSENFHSFETAYSTLKIQKGCKGIGRFLWLKAFESAEIDSTFKENGIWLKRTFSFNSDGVNPSGQKTEHAEGKEEYSTQVTLKNFAPKYKNKAPVELDTVAKKIIEHCLLFFISDQCPEVVISDGISDTINLNQYFNTNIKDSLYQDQFEVNKETFILYHLQLPEGANKHELHFCADMHEVESIELKTYIPELNRKIDSINAANSFYYVGYLTGTYLDSIVNATRTDLDFDEKYGQTSLQGTGKSQLIVQSLAFIKAYLSDYISEIRQNTRKQVDDFVSYEHPTYRYLLGQKPEVYERIPAGLSPEKLDLQLHKEVQIWEREIKLKGQKIEKAANDALNEENTSYHQLFEEYWSGVTELSKTCLAEYVARRKTILSILERTLTIQENGKFKREDAIHSIICPMRHTSDDVDFAEMNLWIVDERLAYHNFLASDKTIKSLPDVDSKSTKEMDIAIFDKAFAFAEDSNPLNTITIIEFKKPDNHKDNPISQMGIYIDEIMSGKKKRSNGLSFGASQSTNFRCFAICDMSPKTESYCKDAGLIKTPDGMGYYGYHQGRNAYFEVISYTKLLIDARKRNQSLFDKLFSPKPSEVMHTSNPENVVTLQDNNLTVLPIVVAHKEIEK